MSLGLLIISRAQGYRRSEYGAVRDNDLSIELLNRVTWRSGCGAVEVANGAVHLLDGNE